MKWLLTASPVLRDVGITITALAIIWTQLLLWALTARPPSDSLLALGLALLGFPLTAAVKAVLGAGTGGTGSSSSPPSQPSLPSSPPSSHQGVARGE